MVSPTSRSSYVPNEPPKPPKKDSTTPAQKLHSQLAQEALELKKNKGIKEPPPLPPRAGRPILTNLGSSMITRPLPSVPKKGTGKVDRPLPSIPSVPAVKNKNSSDAEKSTVEERPTQENKTQEIHDEAKSDASKTKNVLKLQNQSKPASNNFSSFAEKNASITYKDKSSFKNKINELYSNFPAELKDELSVSFKPHLYGINKAYAVNRDAEKKIYMYKTNLDYIEFSDKTKKKTNEEINKLSIKLVESESKLIDLTDIFYKDQIKNQLKNSNPEAYEFYMSSLDLLSRSLEKKMLLLGNKKLSEEDLIEFLHSAKPLVDLIYPPTSPNAQVYVLSHLLVRYREDMQ